MEQETLRKEDSFRFADVALEIILKFDRDGKILYGNSRAKTDLGYGEELTQVSLPALFPAELQQEKYEEGMLLDAMAGMGRKAHIKLLTTDL